MSILRRSFVGMGGVLLGWLSVACGATESASNEGPESEPDELANVPCKPWEPGNADWSSLPGSRPSAVGGLKASASGRYAYAVGAWREAGNSRQQVLRSHDLGETWCVIDTPADIATLAPSPSSETVLYALSAPAAGEGAHLLRTSDGGLTWEESDATLPEGATGELAASAGSVDTVWFVGSELTAQRKLYLSTDGGESWREPSPPAFENRFGEAPDDFIIAAIDGFAVDTAASNRLLAWGRVSTITDTSTRWFQSEDTGESWNELAGPTLTVGESYSGRFSVINDVEGQLVFATESALQRSNDWGETWTELGPLPTPGLAVGTLGGSEPGQPFAWDARGSEPFETEGELWRSTDSGAHWTSLDLPPGGQLLPALAPAKEKLVGLTPLGFSNTDNAGKTWRASAVTALPLYLQQPLTPGAALWATELRGWSEGPGLRSADGGLTWSPTADVSGDVLLDTSDPDVAFSGASWGSVALQLTEDGGNSWSKVKLPQAQIAAATACRDGSSCLYVTLERNVPKGTACSILRSEDRGATWTDEVSIPPALCGELTLQAMPDDPRHLLNGCATAVCESKDGGATWREHSISAQRNVEAILPLSNGVVLAATAAFAAPDVQESPVVARSEDGGATWTEVLKAGAGRFFASAAAPRTVFLLSPVSNEPQAVYRSDDTGLTWQAIMNDANGPPALDVFAIADGPKGKFVAATLQGLVQLR